MPEIWIWQDGALHVFAFRDGEYERATASRFLPGLDFALVERLAEYPDTSDALDEFEAALDQRG